MIPLKEGPPIVKLVETEQSSGCQDLEEGRWEMTPTAVKFQVGGEAAAEICCTPQCLPLIMLYCVLKNGRR